MKNVNVRVDDALYARYSAIADRIYFREAAKGRRSRTSISDILREGLLSAIVQLEAEYAEKSEPAEPQAGAEWSGIGLE